MIARISNIIFEDDSLKIKPDKHFRSFIKQYLIINYIQPTPREKSINPKNRLGFFCDTWKDKFWMMLINVTYIEAFWLAEHEANTLIG